MSGHNKWSSIKHKKGAADAKRGQIFTKIVKELTIAARLGGGDPEANPRLRAAVNKAREANMPKDNIERAIKKGTGELEGVSYEEMRYEGYGPGGVAIIIDCLTDNKNRTTPQIRTIFTKSAGNLGENGCVGYLFDRKGQIIIDAEQTNEDDLMELLLDYDPEDIVTEDNGEIVVTCDTAAFNNISECIIEKGYTTSFNEITMIPQTEVTVEGKQAEQVLRLISVLEEHEDVQNVYSNADIPEEVIEAFEG